MWVGGGGGGGSTKCYWRNHSGWVDVVLVWRGSSVNGVFIGEIIGVAHGCRLIAPLISYGFFASLVGVSGVARVCESY